MREKAETAFTYVVTAIAICSFIWLGQTAVGLSKDKTTLTEEVIELKIDNARLQAELVEKTNALYEVNLELEKERNR